MKLLNRTEISQKKTLEKKQEIDQGIKLARKVDELREKAVLEEQKLKAFKEQTEPELIRQIESLSHAKSALESDIAVLEEQKKVLMQPLDEEWDKLHQHKVVLTELEATLSQKTDELFELGTKLHERSEELKNETLRMSEERRQTQEKLREADSMAKEASETLEKARRSVAILEQEQHTKSEQLFCREENTAVREVNQKLRDEAQDARERELNSRERLLMDREDKLARNIKRYVNNSSIPKGRK